MKTDIKMYNIIELHSGVKGICRYNRVGALALVHQLNKMNPKERYSICAV